MSSQLLAKTYHYNGPGQTLIIVAVIIFTIICGALYSRSMYRQGQRARRRKDF